MPKPFNYVIADPHGLIRLGVTAALAREGGRAIEADNGRDAVAQVASKRPQLAILEIFLPRLNGLCAARQILAGHTGTRVLILTEQTDTRLIDWQIERAFHIGVQGYLHKTLPGQPALLVEAVRAIRGGQTWFDPIVREHQRNFANMPGYAQKERVNLTPKEIIAFHLLAASFSTKRMADEMNISVKTAETHRQNIMNKLGLHDIASLTRYAVGAGIISAR